MEYQPGTIVFWCNLCAGVWIDGNELYDILKIPPDAIPAAVVRNAKTCPKCRTQVFHPVNFPGTDVVIDMCENCKGFWFDRGELQTIRTFVQKEMPKEASKSETSSERVAAWVNNVIAGLLAE